MDRPAPQGVDQPAAPLTIGSGKGGLRGAHAGRADRRIDTLALPDTRAPHRTPAAARRALGAHERAEIEHRLVPPPSAARRHQRIGEGLCLSGAERPPVLASEYARHVGVEYRGVVLERERQDCAGGVRPDARQREQRRERGRKCSLVITDDRVRRGVQEDRPTVVAESGPSINDRAHGSRGSRRHVGEPFEKRDVLRKNACHLGLLQHRLADEDCPRVACVSPRHGARQ
ncbi:unannotated protein [freshwater metagenome]|uniref:Unannotated protein n=1 Tax=freshwater metagenome TaxID=449393 RepID=A0A6J7FVW0_9ZZZZ